MSKLCFRRDYNPIKINFPQKTQAIPLAMIIPLKLVEIEIFELSDPKNKTKRNWEKINNPKYLI